MSRGPLVRHNAAIDGFAELCRFPEGLTRLRALAAIPTESLSDRDVSSPAGAAAVEHWYRHRASIENVFRDSKLGAAMRHLASGYPEVNTAWMWGALLAASIAGWLHQLTASPGPDGTLAGHGVRDGKAMIATLQYRLIGYWAGWSGTPGNSPLRLAPNDGLLAEILARLRAVPTVS